MQIPDGFSDALGGRYELQDVIGRGGMATVYRATDTKHGREVALKVLAPEVASAVSAERFHREIQIAAGLQHPAILTLFDSGEAAGHLYYVMPCVEGPTLADLLRDRGPLPLPEALDIAADIAAALEYAHARGVVHRDVKPGNVLMASGRALLADFGLATALETSGGERLTETGLILGTPRYMSPEQATGRHDVDPRSDVYSLGCVVYEMLAGHPPFEGKSAQALLARHVSDPVPPLRTVRPQLPANVDAVLEKALAKSPADRFATPGALIAALRAPPKTPPRPRRTFTTAAGVAVVGALVAAWQLWPEGRAELPAMRLVRVTADAGPEYSASLNPESTFFVCSQTLHGSMDLFMRPRAGGKPVRLTDGPYDEVTPRWSPDGTSIAYVTGGPRTHAIESVPATGGTPRFLFETGMPVLEAYFDAMFSLGSRPWSADGGTLLASRRMEDGRTAVFALDLATREERQLTSPPPGVTDLEGSWAFDDSRITFSRSDAGRSGVWLLDPVSGEERPLAAEEGVLCFNPCFLPDRQHVVFRSDRAGTENIWAVDVDTGTLTRLTTGGGADQYPVASRDGLVTMTQFQHQTDLYTVDVSSGERRRLTFKTMDNFAARFSPDGRRVAYHCTRTGDAEVMLLDVETGDEVNLSDHPALDVLPEWSPDGRELVFVSNRDGTSRLWIGDARTGRLTRFSEREIALASEVWGVSLSIRWTPDGRALSWVEPDEQGHALWMADREGGPARRVLAGVLRFDWYLDRERVVYTTLAESGLQLRARHLATGADVLLHEGPHTEMVLRRDGSAVALVGAASHFNQNLWWMPLAPGEDGLPRVAGPLEQLTDGEGRWHVHNGGWSPDGARLVFTRDEDDADIFLLVPED